MITPLSNPLFKELLSLDLDNNNYAVFGSSPMYVHGLRDYIDDLDVIVRGDVWEKIKLIGNPHPSNLHSGLEVDVDGGKIQFFNRWISDKWDIDDLIDSAEVIEGIRFVQLAKVLEFKKELNREKDQKDIKILEEYFARN